jgi:hypothetical protein
LVAQENCHFSRLATGTMPPAAEQKMAKTLHPAWKWGKGKEGEGWPTNTMRQPLRHPSRNHSNPRTPLCPTAAGPNKEVGFHGKRQPVPLPSPLHAAGHWAFGHEILDNLREGGGGGSLGEEGGNGHFVGCCRLFTSFSFSSTPPSPPPHIRPSGIIPFCQFTLNEKE